MGKPARNIIKQILPVYKKKYRPDLIIANADNLAHGKGVTEKTAREISECGIDVITCGDHIWDTSQALDIIKENKYNLLCPANLPILDHKKGYKIVKVGPNKVLVINLMGRVFFQKYPDCPFRTADEIIKKNKSSGVKMIVVDFHAEATSEKRAMGFYLDLRVSAVLGTHTHIQTADEEILEGGTAYISDVGMVGPKDSILGCKKEVVIDHMLTQIPFRYGISDDKNILVNAVVVEIEKNGKAVKIERINEVISAVV